MLIKIINRNCRCFLVCAAMLVYSAAGAQEVNVKAELSSDKIQIGDQIKLTLKAEHPSDIRIIWPVVKDTTGKIEFLESSKPDTLLNPNNTLITERQEYIITSFDTGYYPIPPIRFLYQKKGDTTRHLAETRAMLLSVYAPKVDTTKAIKEIKGPLDVPFTFREALPYIIGGWLLLMIVLLIYYFIRKRRKGQKLFVPYVPPRPAHELALEQLDALAKEKLWQQGKYKLYHSRLSDIVRTYIESRFKIRALEYTTDETLRSFSSQTISEMQKEQLTQLLRLSDLAKFAKFEPLPAENELSMKNAYDFITSATPVVQETTEKKEGI